MKSLLRQFFVILLLVISTTLYFPCDNAQAGIVDDIAQVYDTAKTGGKEYFCRKGDAFKGIFSARSFEGSLCRTDTFGALAEYVCTNPNVADFEGSKCDTNAKKNLNGKDPKAVLAEAVAVGIAGPLGKLVNLFYN
jgi:hypothetical protein